MGGLTAGFRRAARPRRENPRRPVAPAGALGNRGAAGAFAFLRTAFLRRAAGGAAFLAGFLTTFRARELFRGLPRLAALFGFRRAAGLSLAAGRRLAAGLRLAADFFLFLAGAFRALLFLRFGRAAARVFLRRVVFLALRRVGRLAVFRAAFLAVFFLAFLAGRDLLRFAAPRLFRRAVFRAGFRLAVVRRAAVRRDERFFARLGVFRARFAAAFFLGLRFFVVAIPYPTSVLRFT